MTKQKSMDSRTAVKTTIVGGQPLGNERVLAEVPIGLEQLLAMAASSEEFRRALLDDRESAVEVSGVTLTRTERAILHATSDPVLERMVSQVDVRLPKPERRQFLERAAAAVVLLVGSGAAAGCQGKGATPSRRGKAEPVPKDLRPMDSVRPDAGVQRTHPPAGIRPRVLEPPNKPPMREPDQAGARPDRPAQPLAGVRPRRDPAPAGSAGVRISRPGGPRVNAGARVGPSMVPEERPRPRKVPQSRGISPRRRLRRPVSPPTGIRPGRGDDDLE
ncbi:MAG: hypothetical protein ABI333_24995 [bacterium]